MRPSIRKLKNALVAAGRWTLRLAAAFVVTSFLQVLLVRFIDPPFTLTMVQRVMERGWAGEGWDWVAQDNVSLEAMGDFPKAAVASEDGRFWFHNGFDAQGICHAIESNRKGKRLRGGSTISQQVARNVFLVQRRSWVRKGLEVWYTGLLELLVPKARILELYGNVAETGPHTFGVEAGALHWYGTSAAKLSQDQAFRMVYLLPDPRRRSPRSGEAGQKASWVRGHRVPFPDETGFDVMRKHLEKEGGTWGCLVSAM